MTEATIAARVVVLMMIATTVGRVAATVDRAVIIRVADQAAALMTINA
jgi:hypothetical protein